MDKLRVVAASSLAAAIAMAAVPAHASLVPLTNADLTGQGIGAQTTVLTLQSPGSTTTESGGVNFNGTVFGDAKTGASQSTTFTFAQLGISSANQLALIVNLSEPGSENPPSVGPYTISLNAFSSTGTPLGTFSGSGSQLIQINGGVGGSGIVFGLDAPQATTLNNLLLTPGNEVFTVSASFGNAQGGLDVIQAAGITAAVPEPSTWAMMLLGFAGLGFMGYRRKAAFRLV
jgi:hypothetical protein